MISWVLIQLMILLWAIWMFWRYFFGTRNKSGLPEPPGPYGVPLLGYLPFLGSAPELTFDKLAQQYGDIFQVQMGMQKAVVLNSLEAIKEALNKVGNKMIQNSCLQYQISSEKIAMTDFFD
jgi:hypothetical protein